jgi:beta-glucosidase
MKFQFPKNFLWGAATSAHQVEGGLINDWSEWEKENCDILAKKGWERASDWQREKFPEIKNPTNYISGKAADHYNLYDQDFAMAQELGHNATRISIAWERIEPSEGIFNEKELDHYLNVIKSMKRHGLEPFVTLYHWPVPLWFRDIGGWENKKAVEYFARYTQKVVEKLKDEVKFWIVINEPWVYTTLHYFQGDRPPAKKNLFSAWRVYDKLAVAHNLAYDEIKKIDNDAQVGSSHLMIWFEANPNNLVNRWLKSWADWYVNNRWFDLIGGKQDFIGLNHYHHDTVNWGFAKNADKQVNDLGWELYPESIFQVLMMLKKYKKPVYITENGLADAEDSRRKWYLEECLKYVCQAIEKGVDVRGYLHWSLLDNFEWDYGYWPRFGLIEVDFEKLTRRPRKSARWYKEVCKNNGF